MAVLSHRPTRLPVILGLVVLLGCGPTQDDGGDEPGDPAASPEGETAEAPTDRGPAEGDETFSSEELHEGVELSVQGNDDTVLRAVAFHPGESPMEVPEEHFRSLRQGEAVTVHNDLRDFDMAVIYRTGPYCGLLPHVELRDTDPPEILVDPGNEGIDYREFTAEHGVECPDMEFDEAVGFDLRNGVDVEAVELHVRGR